jgi:hypothetical protein
MTIPDDNTPEDNTPYDNIPDDNNTDDNNPDDHTTGVIWGVVICWNLVLSFDVVI